MCTKQNVHLPETCNLLTQQLTQENFWKKLLNTLSETERRPHKMCHKYSFYRSVIESKIDQRQLKYISVA